jgi:hypothetical protein
VISIGAQGGGPLAQLKVDLFLALERHCRAVYCPAIDEFALVLRLSGAYQDFGPEAIECLKRRRPSRYITVDIVVPVQAWIDVARNEQKAYLARQCRAALTMCVDRLKKDKEQVNEELFYHNVDNAIAEFLADPESRGGGTLPQNNRALRASGSRRDARRSK